MIRKIKVSEKDTTRLSEQTDIPAPKNDEGEYNNLVIKKPWGFEYLLFQNRFSSVWILSINRGHGTSFHCHPNKKTSLVVLSGEAVFKTHHDETYLRAGDALEIDKATFHSTRATAPGITIVLETETPNYKKDLVRLDDTYGRQHEGYEGQKYHIPLSHPAYSHLPVFADASHPPCAMGDCVIKVLSISKSGEFSGKFSRDSIVIVVRGQFTAGDAPVELGTVLSGGQLKDMGDLTIVDDVELLIIETMS